LLNPTWQHFIAEIYTAVSHCMRQVGTGTGGSAFWVGQVGLGQCGLQIRWDRMGLGQGGLQMRWDRMGLGQGVFRLGGTGWDWDRSLFDLSLSQWDRFGTGSVTVPCACTTWYIITNWSQKSAFPIKNESKKLWSIQNPVFPIKNRSQIGQKSRLRIGEKNH